MKIKLRVESIHQTVQPECDPPLRFNIRLVDDSGLVVQVTSATAVQMLPFAKIDSAGNPVQRRDSSFEAGDVITWLDNDPVVEAEPFPLPPSLPGDPVEFPKPS